MLHEIPEQVAHLDLDTFFVSVERLRDSRLNGLPILVGGKSDRAVVAACSYEARRFGIRSAMPMKMAKRLCPEAICISGDFEAYMKYSDLVTEVIAERAPLYEKASIDEFYLDMTGMDRFFGSWKWAGELRDLIHKETGLPLSLGMSVNKLVAKVATGEAKPNGRLQVASPVIQDFLSPMPVRKIPSIGPKTSRELAMMGVRRVAILQQIPKEILEHIYGKHGSLLWQRARGIDNSPIIPSHDAKSLSTEQTFEVDTIDVVHLKACLTRMASKLAYRLRSSQRLCNCITVKVRYANFDTHTRQVRIPLSAQDGLLIEKALQLFDKLYERRLRIRLVGIRLSGLVHGSYQLSLLEDTPQQVALYQAVDGLKDRFGEGVIGRGSGIGRV